jgi:predicted ABC-type ATPase
MSGRVLIIAGPNGAGKTTFARQFLPREGNLLNFINADLIAAGLSPFRPEVAAIEAGRLMLTEIARLFAKRESFAFESTLSGRSYARMISDWQAAGYHVEIMYLKLRSIRIAQARIRARARQGGHSIPADVIKRRFERSWQNFERIYRPLVDHWELYENSGSAPVLLDKGVNR